MKICLKFDHNIVCKKVLEEKLKKFDIKNRSIAFGEIEFLEKISEVKLKEIQVELEEYGITIIENQKSVLVEKIKETIMEMIQSADTVNVKASVYLTEKLNHSYGYLSNLFSEITFSSIENFIMLQKIESAKNLIIKDNLTLTEVAYRLNYSSVAHLSTQFKNITGITPSQFQRIIHKRRTNASRK